MASKQEVIDMVRDTDLSQELKDEFYLFISIPPGMDIAGSMFGILKADAAAADRIKTAVLKLLHRQPSTAGSAFGASGGAGGAADLALLRDDVATIKRLTLETSRATRHASSIQLSDLEALEGALQITFVSVSAGIIPDAAAESLRDTTDFTWEANKHEAKHRDEYLQAIADQVKLPNHLVWSFRTDKHDTLKTCMHAGGAELPFSIGCRTDAMVVAHNSQIVEEGSLAATIELKKKVVQQSLRQTKATYICASLKSHLPVISCVTDMGQVGVAYYTSGQRMEDGTSVVVQLIFPSHVHMLQWLSKALSSESVQSDVLRLKGDDVVIPTELPNPKRVRLPVPHLKPAHAKELQHMLADFIRGGADVGCMDDVDGPLESYVQGSLSYFT